MYRGRTTRHSRPQLVLARRAHHTPLSRSVGFCMQLLFCMHRGHTTRHSRAQLAHVCSWFLHVRRAHHTPPSRSVGSCMHGGHTTRHSRAQLVFARTAISSLVVADRPSNTMISRGIAISMIFFYTLCLLHTSPLGFNLTASEPADLFGGKTPGRVFRSARMHTEFQIQITSETAFLNCPCLSLH